MQPLRDTYNRTINYLRISITDRCNLRCFYCMPKQGVSPLGHDVIMRYEEIIRIATVAADLGITKIRVTGGEPLVRKGITDLIADLNAIPGIEELSITTNGVLLKAAAPALREAGLKRINISLDTLDPQNYSKITRGGDINTVLAGITEARIQGFQPIKINVVTMRGINDHDIEAFARLTLERPVHIRFIEFMPIDKDSSWDEKHFIANDEILDRLRSVGPLTQQTTDKQAGPATMYQFEGAAGKLGFISPLSNHFCDTCNRLRLTADGKLRTCLFSDNETDLKTPLRDGCSQDELRHIMAQAIMTKPKGHTMSEPTFRKCFRNMSAIGG